MKPGADENEVRRHFNDLRRTDSDRAPSFESILRIRRSRSRRNSRTAIVTLLLGTTAACVLLLTIWHQRRDSAVMASSEIVHWHPASDALLIGARETMLLDMPPLKASVLDSILP